jgi:transposase
MPVPRIKMRLVREVLRLKFAASLSHRQIAAALRIGVGSVSNYLAAFERAGLKYPLPSDLVDIELERLLFPPVPPKPKLQPSRFVSPDFLYIHEQLRLKGVTRQLLWEEYCAQYSSEAYSYTQFCVLYKEFKDRLRLSMRQTHTPGEKVFVDYCGKTVPIINSVTGEITQAQIFVAVLGASNYTFADAPLSQKLSDWIGSHIRAFDFFGGVPQLVVPDNLKSAVDKACRYEPLLNQTYAEMLIHYNTIALPARPYKPKDKAKAEVGVQVVTRWILARLRHERFFSLFELNLAIRRLLDELNSRPFKRLPGTRREAFLRSEKAHLQPLPVNSYEYAEWKKARVGIDYHIEIERHFYSVPHSFRRHQIEVRITGKTIECFAGGKRIAVHVRSHLCGAHSTQAEHMPKSHRAHLEWTPGRFLNWANEIGEATRQVVKHLLWTRPHPEMGYRSCLGLLNLEKRYGRERLEAAARLALDVGTPARRSIVSILEQGLDRLPPAEEINREPLFHENIRGSSYYQ